jgi:hypothetical protein
MDVFGVENEYNWVIKILKSSNSISHIEMSDKILNFFFNKWDGILNEDQKNTFYYDFLNIKENMIQKIKKNDVLV